MFRHKGFTLIELITVIAILGALAVIALPRFINLQDEADAAALQGVVGSAGAASAVNLAGALAGDTAAVTVTQCSNIENALADGTPSGYTISGGAIGSQTADSTQCTVTQTSTGNTGTFSGYRVPNPG